ncbi:MAG: AraC family transcriptional regulator, partial [Pseudomonas sp.]
MSQLDQSQVFQTMASSPNSRLLHSAELGDGLAAALWSNCHDTRDYQAPSHHTLSCYLAGGTGTFRRERPDSKGAPDK